MSYQITAKVVTGCPAHYGLGDVLRSYPGKWEESVDVFAKSCDLGETQDPCAHYAYALYRAGREAEAREAVRLASDMKDDRRGTRRLARYFARAGDRAEALRFLRRTVAFGYRDGDLDHHDLASLHGDPEFEAIVAEMKKRFGKD